MDNPKTRDIFVVAAWVALFAGVLEGIVQCVARLRPVLNAAHKMSPDALWVAPALNVPFFLLGALALLPIFIVLRRKFGEKAWVGLYGIFLSGGFYLVLTAPEILNNVGAAFLSVGLAVAVCRAIGARVEPFTLRLRRRLWCIPAVLLVLWLGVAGVERLREFVNARTLPTAAGGTPNVLVVVMDTVRADRFQPWRTQSLTPTFDRLAAGGVRFDNAWSTTSWSLPSQASILSGLYTFQHGADWPSAQMHKDVATLPEYFASKGYVAGAFSGNSAWVTPEYLGRGFLRFRVYILEDLLRRTTLGRKLDLLSEQMGYHSAGRGKKAPRLNQEFLAFLDAYPGRPYFAYLCYMDVNQEMHDLWLNKNGSMPEVAKEYDAALTRLDAHIGELLAELQERGRLENTLIVLTSDHGESFSAEVAPDRNPKGHGSSLYREQSAIPMLVNFPGKVPAGLASTRTVSLAQIPATILDLLGWQEAPFRGDSLSAAWHESATGTEPTVLAELRDLDGKEMQASAFRGTWQYLNTPRKFKMLEKGEELFNLSTDPGSQHSLAGQPEAGPKLVELRDWVVRERNAYSARLPRIPASRAGNAAKTRAD